MPVLLIVHHTASPVLHSLFDAVMTGAREGAAADPATPVDVVARPALSCTAVDAPGRCSRNSRQARTSRKSARGTKR